MARRSIDFDPRWEGTADTLADLVFLAAFSFLIPPALVGDMTGVSLPSMVHMAVDIVVGAVLWVIRSSFGLRPK